MAERLSDPGVRERLVEFLYHHWPRPLSEHHPHPPMPNRNIDYYWDEATDRRQWVGFSEHDVVEAGPGQKEPDWAAVYADLGCLAGQRPDARVELTEPRHEYGTPAEAALTYTTDPISLTCDETDVTVDLGAFDVTISVVLRPYGTAERRLEAQPLNPNYAAGSDDISHPHVDGGDVCLGHGRRAFNDALAELRFSDAFDVADAVLHTYGSDSPYRSLASWHGTPCSNCNAVLADEDDVDRCLECDEDFCPECDPCSCDGCSDVFHMACLERCRRCGARTCSGCHDYVESEGESYCRGCTGQCDRCDHRFLDRDIDGDGYCPECRDPECSECGDQFPEDELAGGLCEKCRKEPCGSCGSNFDPDELDAGLCPDCKAGSEESDAEDAENPELEETASE